MMSTDPLLIFDGDCGFCTSSANFIVKHSSLKLSAQPWQYVNLDDYGITEKEASAKVQLWLDGKIYAGHEAVAQILQAQKNQLLRLIGKLALWPVLSQLARFLYFLTAKYRHKLPGGTPACRLPRQ